MDLIRDGVASDTWKSNGGTNASIESFASVIITDQLPEHHAEISHFLEEVRVVLSVTAQHVPLPPGVSEEDLYQQPETWGGGGGGFGSAR